MNYWRIFLESEWPEKPNSFKYLGSLLNRNKKDYITCRFSPESFLFCSSLLIAGFGCNHHALINLLIVPVFYDRTRPGRLHFRRVVHSLKISLLVTLCHVYGLVNLEKVRRQVWGGTCEPMHRRTCHSILLIVRRLVPSKDLWRTIGRLGVETRSHRSLFMRVRTGEVGLVRVEVLWRRDSIISAIVVVIVFVSVQVVRWALSDNDSIVVINRSHFLHVRVFVSVNTRVSLLVPPFLVLITTEATPTTTHEYTYHTAERHAPAC